MKIKTLIIYLFVGFNIAVFVFPGNGAQVAGRAELTEWQAIARVKSVLRKSASSCRITKTQNISAIRVKSGWRVTARINMSVSGLSRREAAIWIVSSAKSISPQNQLTADITIGCP